ncbi:hypothetical protein B5F12_09655 [Pseudoflavonifractor sp. An176]|nr:hypothetical protein B5F12_09655 [Pseudoflavonifractor sp. An176]
MQALKIAAYLGLLGVGEGLAPPESSPWYAPGFSGRASPAPTTAQQEGAANVPDTCQPQSLPQGGRWHGVAMTEGDCSKGLKFLAQ